MIQVFYVKAISFPSSSCLSNLIYSVQTLVRRTTIRCFGGVSFESIKKQPFFKRCLFEDTKFVSKFWLSSEVSFFFTFDYLK